MTHPTPPPLTDPPATLLPAPSHPDLIAGGDALVRCLVLVLDAKAFELVPELVGAFGGAIRASMLTEKALLLRLRVACESLR
jgi:hypothetical protein